MKKIQLNLKKLKSEYLSGKTQQDLATLFKCSKSVVAKNLRLANVYKEHLSNIVRKIIMSSLVNIIGIKGAIYEFQISPIYIRHASTDFNNGSCNTIRTHRYSI